MRLNKKSFTLIEILIGTAIMIIVIGMVYTIFSGTLGYWKRGYGLASRQQAARTLISRMTGNISSLFISTPRNIYCFGSKEKFYFIFASIKGSEGDLAEMGYEFIPTDNTIAFSYQERADFDFDTYDSKKTMAINILGLNFSYLDKQGSWLDEWDSRQGGEQEEDPPQAIKISFDIENNDFPDKKETFETVVELPIRTKYQ